MVLQSEKKLKVMSEHVLISGVTGNTVSLIVYILLLSIKFVVVGTAQW